MEERSSVGGAGYLQSAGQLVVLILIHFSPFFLVILRSVGFGKRTA